jgi:hypothetical protein
MTEAANPGTARPLLRLEATLHGGERNVNLEGVLDVDRIPGAEGEVRVLVTAEEAARLVERGLEVHLLRAHRVEPLDSALISDDDAAYDWLEKRVAGIDRESGA